MASMQDGVHTLLEVNQGQVTKTACAFALGKPAWPGGQLLPSDGPRRGTIETNFARH